MSADLRESRRHGHGAGTSCPSVNRWGNPIPSLVHELDAISSQAILCIVLVCSVGQHALDLLRVETPLPCRLHSCPADYRRWPYD